ncbi:Gamma-tubulin complex component 2 isoform B [Glycine soja]|uniref:Gamma-tubulin complex component n=2 Tax=Glycine soja TaxID=3848 RepID=A0A445F0Y0_GLYSO|nr:Gamma-tubulin complex component 2 isoform B [Glycine soja]
MNQTAIANFEKAIGCYSPSVQVLALADWFCSLRMCLLRELVACFWLLIMELIVIDDVLSAMVGIEGRYILIKTICGKSDDITFLVDPSMDLALQELAKRIFPLCKSFLLINQFVESRSEFQSGLVNHAFSAALRALLLRVLGKTQSRQRRVVDSTKITMVGALHVAESHCTTAVALSLSDKVESGEKLHQQHLSMANEESSNPPSTDPR